MTPEKIVSGRHYRMLLQHMAPPPVVDCLTWNLKFGRLSSRDSAKPGAWSDVSTPYVRHWLDLASARKQGKRFLIADPYAHLTEQIWIVKGTQTGLTRSVLFGIIGWNIDQNPSPSGYFLPRLDDLKDIQKERLMPFFRETPKLRALLPEEGSSAYRTGFTYSNWTFPACDLHFLSSSIALELRSKPLCDEYWDEYDKSPLDVEGEGDAIDLGLDRQKTFARRRLTVGVTTPTSLSSAGWARLISGSHERLLVACIECGADQELSWDGLRIYHDDISSEPLTLEAAAKSGIETQKIMVAGALGATGYARWACAHCGRLHTTFERDQIVLKACGKGQDNHWIPGKWVMDNEHPRGEWIPSADFDSGHRLTDWARCETTIRTGHLHSLYSSFCSLGECAAREISLIRAGTPDKWKAHRNNWRGEPTVPQATQDTPTPESITVIHDCRTPRYSCPEICQKILITCDQQGNEKERCWFPYVVRGWAPFKESFLIDCGSVNSWEALKALENRLWYVGKTQRPCDAISLDGANYNMAQHTQEWQIERGSKRLIIAGVPNFALPIMRRGQNDARKPQTSRSKLMQGVRWFKANPDAWKTMLQDRIKGEPGAPPWNLCAEPPKDYLFSLGSEYQLTVRDKNGIEKTVWRPRIIISENGVESERKDTHWWDCEWHQIAVAHVLKYDQLKPKEVEQERHAPQIESDYLAGYGGTV